MALTPTFARFARLALVGLVSVSACGDDAKPAADATTPSDSTSDGTSATDATPDSTSATDATPDSTTATDATPDSTTATDTTPDSDTTTDDTSTDDATDDASTDATTDDASTDADDATPDAGDTSTGPVFDGPCPLAKRLGGFQAVDDGEFGYAEGTVADSVLPVSVLEIVQTEGECTLYRKNNPFCAPPCSPSETCTFAGTCIAYPAPQNLGTVTLSGLEGGDVVMNPVQPGNLYFATEIPYPPWIPGAAIQLRTAGGAFEAITLDGVAPKTLVPADAQWVLTTGQPLVVSWDAPAGAVESKVEMQLLIDQHGNAPASLRCVFEDDGQGTLPASILDQLRSSGVSGFPTGKLVRQTVDSAAIGTDGCVDFATRSPRTVKVVVSGHIPCKKDSDCPSGKHCDEPVETCVDN